MLRRLTPEGPDLDPNSPAFREELAELYRPAQRALLRANLVMSANGSMVGADGTSTPLSFPLDRTVLKIIRSFADAVVVGASSVRAEGYSMPSHGALVVITASGDLEGHWLGTGGDGELLVLAPESAHGAVREALIGRDAALAALPRRDEQIDWPGVLGLLADRGYRSLVSEGGPRFTRTLIEQGVLDELCLTQVRETSTLVIPAPFEIAALPEPHLLLEDSSNGARFSRRRLR